MIIIFSGYNQRAVIAFLRTLEKNCVLYGIVACTKEDEIFNTVYGEKVEYIRKDRKLNKSEMVKAINKIRKKYNKEEESAWIAPSTEYLNRYLLKNRIFFEKNNCVIPLVNEELYEKISDKEKFYMLCKKNLIDVPQSYDYVEKYEKPIVAKPKKYVASDKKIYSPIFITSEEELVKFKKEHQKDDFLYNEFIKGGDSFYLMFYFTRSGKVFKFSQKNIAQQAGGKSILAAVGAPYHLSQNIVKKYIKMFRKENFYGLVMVEIRRSEGIDYMIEANPRFWGPSQLFCDSKNNLFECMLEDFGIINKRKSEKADIMVPYFWSGGISGNIVKNKTCVWHGEGKKYFEMYVEDFKKHDIYGRKDTMKEYYVEKMKNLYMETSKHSKYQILADPIRKMINQDELDIKSRQEQERLDYIVKNINLEGKNVLDIGGNTGYFTFEALEKKAKHVDYYEGNTNHAEFVRTAKEAIGYKDKLTVYDEYFDFEKNKKRYDVIFNLNVLHHLGDDFGEYSKKKFAKEKMREIINKMAQYTDIMVFQMGYNWMGNISENLFENGTKTEMIEFVKESNKFWDVLYVGIAQKNQDGDIVYENVNHNNKKRDDSLGEFLNRPIFIMKSKVVNVEVEFEEVFDWEMKDIRQEKRE